MTRLLVVDDRDRTVEMCHRHLPHFDYMTRCDREAPCQVCELRDQGCRLKCAHDYFEAREALQRHPRLPDLVVLDLHFALPEERLLPEDKSALPAAARARAAAVEELRRTQGLLILERLRRDFPLLPVVLLTTTDEVVSGPDDPLLYFCAHEVVDSRALAAEISRALALRHAEQEGPVFWGQSPAMAALRRDLDALARSPVPVLLQGETGTGKSYLAEQVIHPRSGQKGPFVVTDLAAVPQSLLAAHLFGSRRGAFTGAIEDHVGVFEQAHGGTLFLDEIGNLDLDLQRQLLLVIERGAVTRLGDAAPRPAHPKLIAATNQDLEALVAAGRFRHDLWMRLNPASRLRLPPLRERREDLTALIRFALLDALRSELLQPLVRQYLARFPTPEGYRPLANQVIYGRPRAASAAADAFTVFIGEPSRRALLSHDWPGNHRELNLFAVNALVRKLSDQLDAPAPTARAPAILEIDSRLLQNLIGRRGGGAADAARSGIATAIEIRPGASFAQVAADVERQYLCALYRTTGGDLERMARLLLGPAGTRRRVTLRLNQLGLKLRQLRELR
ncbi:MAG: sigma-54-dependent Fis family transcriptional regulator [Deltaproteobacteria bacterium]|nr:sigma-54-dependent Fis family transcriptional regulator [Deltaproteobacteria bacterium]